MFDRGTSQTRSFPSPPGCWLSSDKEERAGAYLLFFELGDRLLLEMERLGPFLQGFVLGLDLPLKLFDLASLIL